MTKSFYRQHFPTGRRRRVTAREIQKISEIAYSFGNVREGALIENLDDERREAREHLRRLLADPQNPAYREAAMEFLTATDPHLEDKK